MAVIINDFEVVVDGPSAADAERSEPAPAAAGAAPPLSPHDLDELERYRLERAARVCAH